MFVTPSRTNIKTTWLRNTYNLYPGLTDRHFFMPEKFKLPAGRAVEIRFQAQYNPGIDIKTTRKLRHNI